MVLTCRFAAEQGPLERVAAARRAGLLAARHLAAATLNVAPASTRRYSLAPARRRVVPRVAYICPGMILSALHQTFLDGVPLNVTPAVLHPAELLDGAVVSGNYDIAATRTPTYFYQRNPIVEELFARHAAGELAFCGVVVTLCLINPYVEKLRSASLAARAARLLGAEGVVISIEECGHAYADLMLTCQACEDIGLKTMLLTAESAGAEGDKPAQLAFARGADAVVSVGNMDERLRAAAGRARVGRRGVCRALAAGSGGAGSGRDVAGEHPGGDLPGRRQASCEGRHRDTHRPLPQPVLRRDRRRSGRRCSVERA